jgi:hypothetical protein
LPVTPAATLAAVQLPTVPETPTYAVLGVITLQNGSAGNFVPGTTNTNTASLTWGYYAVTSCTWPIQIL